MCGQWDECSNDLLVATSASPSHVCDLWPEYKAPEDEPCDDLHAGEQTLSSDSDTAPEDLQPDMDQHADAEVAGLRQGMARPRPRHIEGEYRRVQDYLDVWNEDGQSCDFPVLVLPDPIVFLIMHKQWAQLQILARWHIGWVQHKVATPLVLGWPPPEAQVWLTSGK